MDEKLLFNQDGIRVSRNSIMVNHQTYPIDAISTVSFREIEPRRWLAYISLVIGLTLLLEEGALFAVGGILSIFAIVSGLTAKLKYAVVINTINAEKQVITSENSAYIQQIVHAIDAAMVNRYKSSKSHAPPSAEKDISNHQSVTHKPSTAH